MEAYNERKVSLAINYDANFINKHIMRVISYIKLCFVQNQKHPFHMGVVLNVIVYQKRESTL